MRDCREIWDKMRDPENRDVRITHDGKYSKCRGRFLGLLYTIVDFQQTSIPGLIATVLLLRSTVKACLHLQFLLRFSSSDACERVDGL